MKVAPDGSLALGLDVEPRVGRADTGDLEVDLTELVLDLGETGLEKRGLLYAPDRGTIVFTVPGMSDCIDRRGL